MEYVRDVKPCHSVGVHLLGDLVDLFGSVVQEVNHGPERPAPGWQCNDPSDLVGNRSRVRLRRAEGNQSVHELIEHAVELDVSGFFLITLPVQGGRARVMRLAMPRSRPH
jgi:hypothetical protein